MGSSRGRSIWERENKEEIIGGLVEWPMGGMRRWDGVGKDLRLLGWGNWDKVAKLGWHDKGT